jgi:hypothetical protein
VPSRACRSGCGIRSGSAGRWFPSGIRRCCALAAGSTGEGPTEAGRPQAVFKRCEGRKRDPHRFGSLLVVVGFAPPAPVAGNRPRLQKGSHPSRTRSTHARGRPPRPRPTGDRHGSAGPAPAATATPAFLPAPRGAAVEAVWRSDESHASASYHQILNAGIARGNHSDCRQRGPYAVPLRRAETPWEVIGQGVSRHRAPYPSGSCRAISSPLGADRLADAADPRDHGVEGPRAQYEHRRDHRG